jgi:plasmid stabilization system protein ParE
VTIRFTRLAVSDVTEIRDRYEGVDELLEQRFLDQLDVVMERLLAFPMGAPPVDGFPGVRRARLRRFPYGVFYRADDGDIIVLRVLHTRRSPTGLDSHE